MQWTDDAEKAIKKVPFFVRKKVRLRVENDAENKGKELITLDDVKAAKAAYLTKMSSKVKGYQIDACFGPEGCQNRASLSESLAEKIEEILNQEDLLGFLKERVDGDIKPHHEFRVTIADCPNACSQPQIKDIGIIGASVPKITEKECTLCNACIDICREKAIAVNEKLSMPVLDFSLCLKCGQCVGVCPTGTIEKGETGFRVLLGGKLGRHPRLARELSGIYDENGVIEIVKTCIHFYKEHSRYGERFAEILKDLDLKKLTCPPSSITKR